MRLAAKGRKLGKIREAEKYLKRAVEVDDLAAGAWADLAEVELALGRRVAAESAARRAVRLDRRNSGYRDVLGRIMKTE
jgi:tetratricopeptide (TPR) repeat protein